MYRLLGRICPRIATGKPATLKIGHVISGVLEKPHSNRNTASIAHWDYACVKEWGTFAPYTLISPEHFATTTADIVDIPQLGGCRFSRPDPQSLTISPPYVPTEVMQAISARAHDLNAAALEIAHIAESRCDNSLGRAAVFNVLRRVTLSLATSSRFHPLIHDRDHRIGASHPPTSLTNSRYGPGICSSRF